jgi:hypothetical protein
MCHKSKKGNYALNMAWKSILRIAHCQDSRLLNGREVVSLTHRPRSISRKKPSVLACGTHFC